MELRHPRPDGFDNRCRGHLQCRCVDLPNVALMAALPTKSYTTHAKRDLRLPFCYNQNFFNTIRRRLRGLTNG